MNKEIKRIIYNEILDQLSEYYKSKGFRLTWNKMLFSRGDSEVYFLESRDDGESISFTPQIRSTNVDIKKILDRVFPKNLINPTSVQNAGPLMANMLNCDDFDSREYNGFGELDFYIYRISKPLELKPVITDHVEFMDKVGLAFFERLSPIDSIDQFLSSFILEGNIDYYLSKNRQDELGGYFSGRESFSSLCAAYHNHNKHYDEIFDRLSQSWNGILIQKNITALNLILREDF